MAASGAVLRSSLQVIYWKLDPPRGVVREKGFHWRGVASRGWKSATYESWIGGSPESLKSERETDMTMTSQKV